MASDHVDVLIIGAGLSGIGAAHHLQEKCPGKSYAILEAREAIGGTWDLFRYPGIRSDSDMFTLGYSFRPWEEAKAIADGPSILNYVRDTAREGGIERHIRFQHRVVRAEWSSDEARWTVEAERTDTGETVELTAGFLFTCTGYYKYDEPYTPDLPGLDTFKGQVIHPQLWSDDIDYKGKRVVVIGSGATAVTLVPAMAEDAAHVTMLQRSPSYVIAMPGRDPIADVLRKLLPSKVAYPLVRWKNVALATTFFQLSRRRPKLIRRLILKGVEQNLGSDYAIDPHFSPTYNPWDQRVCLVPDADLFRAIKKGHASMETDTIETFTDKGIRLASGKELEADIVVTATGLQLQALGGMDISVDGRDVVLNETLGYKGMMFSDVPNLAVAMGYTNASWTLKCDLTCEYVCRVLKHMDERGYAQVTPRNHDPDLETQPMIDLKSGYVERAIHLFPRQGLRKPWRLYQNYARDILMLRFGALEDDALEFRPAPKTAREPERVAA
jgi:cation diffusion facilitator CzcD-associated flavoprotein CzcO